jgi:SGNH domain (fused to AT3 domains)
VLSLSRWTVGIHWWSAPFQVALMLLLAAGSYRYVETPLRHSEWSPVRWRSIGYGLGASAGAASLMVALFLVRTRLYTGQKYLGSSLHQENLISETSVSQTNCMLAGGKCFSDLEFEQCYLPPRGDMPTLFFVGSSHAMHLAGLGEGLHKRGFGVAFLTMQGHNLMPEAPDGPGPIRFKTPQEEAIVALLNARAERGSIIVVANRYFQESYDAVFDDAYFKSMGAFADWFGRKGIAVVHVLPLPEYSFHDINQCAPQWFNAGMRNSGICLPTEPLRRVRQFRDVETRMAGSRYLVNYDPVKVLCPSGIAGCYPIDRKTMQPTFRNPDHLSNFGASLLVDDFVAFLRSHSLTAP